MAEQFPNLTGMSSPTNQPPVPNGGLSAPNLNNPEPTANAPLPEPISDTTGAGPNNSVLPATPSVEPPDPYAAFSPTPPESKPSPSIPQPVHAATQEAAVSSQPSASRPSESVVTAGGDGARRRVLMLIGALVLIVVLLILGSFIYSSLTGKKAASPSPTPTSKAANPSITQRLSPTPVNSLPSDIPAYGSGNMTIVTGPKGQLRTEQKSNDEVDKIINFYKTELAKNGWTVGNITKEGNAQKFTATKGSREVLVQVTRNGNESIIGLIIKGSSLGDTGAPRSASSTATPKPTVSDEE